MPNGFGLYDMHGNVSEWCWDPSPAKSGAAERVLRGGGWIVAVGYCGGLPARCTSRTLAWSDGGFRLARIRPERRTPSKGRPLRRVKEEGDEPPAVARPEPELAIAPFDAALAVKHQKASADYLKQPVVEKSRTGIEMVLIPPGGGKLTQPWRLGKYEVAADAVHARDGLEPQR